MTRKTSAGQQPDGCSLGGVVIVLIILFGLISQCGSRDQGNSEASGVSGSFEEDNSQTQGDYDWPEVGKGTVSKAARHAARAVGALGADGARTYSENCQALLKGQFSVVDYDRCYAFDLFAGRLTDGVDPFFSAYAIDSRWTRGFDPVPSAALSNRRDKIADAAQGISVSPEAPPATAATSNIEDTANEAEAADTSVAPDEPVDEVLDAGDEAGPASF